jgi:hypothetical protein
MSKPPGSPKLCRVGKWLYAGPARDRWRAGARVCSDPYEEVDGTQGTAPRLQWGRLLGTQAAGRNARFDFSADGIQARDDAVRTKNRWVASATLTIPAGDNISIPISLNYANRPEFLTGQTKQLGVHLGLTYRLPFENLLPPVP